MTSRTKTSQLFVVERTDVQFGYTYTVMTVYERAELVPIADRIASCTLSMYGCQDRADRMRAHYSAAQADGVIAICETYGVPRVELRWMHITDYQGKPAIGRPSIVLREHASDIDADFALYTKLFKRLRKLVSGCGSWARPDDLREVLKRAKAFGLTSYKYPGSNGSDFCTTRESVAAFRAAKAA